MNNDTKNSATSLSYDPMNIIVNETNSAGLQIQIELPIPSSGGFPGSSPSGAIPNTTPDLE